MPQFPLTGVRIGHWVFWPYLTKDRSATTWLCKCALCGAQFTTSERMVLPVAGRLYLQRRRHDEKQHPESVADQNDLECGLLSKRERNP